MALLDETFAQRTRDEWGTRFAEHGVWWTPVNSVEDLLVDPQAEAAGLFVDVPTTREGADGPDRSLAAPADFGSATDTDLSAPRRSGRTPRTCSAGWDSTTRTSPG
jgi:crotonobetainyl-CoA:carnitine CoA-transferase CaiB-like acyl-CoA transferase